MRRHTTLLEWTPFSKTHLPHWRSSFSDPNELLNLSLWLDLLQRGHFLYFQIFWNSYFYFFSVCFHFQTWDAFMKLKNNTKNFWLKIFINKKSSDLAQNLRAVRAPEGLTAHKISAKSDDILLTQIFKWNFGISWTVTCLFFSCFENWETKSQSVCLELKFKKRRPEVDQVWGKNLIAHIDQKMRFYNEVSKFLKTAWIPLL